LQYIAIHGMAQQKYQGLLWEITGNNLKSPSYLYGTMHVSNRVAFHLSDTFFLGLRQCEVVALEMNPEGWLGDMMNSPENPMIASPGFYSGQNYKGFYKRAFNVNIPENKELAQLLFFENAMTNGMLYRSSEASEDYQENTYLDLFIFQAGRKMDKEIASLEVYDEVMQLAKKAQNSKMEEDKAMARSRKLLMDLDQNPYELLEEAYRKGDLDRIDSLSRILNGFGGFGKFMLDQRNVNMAARMDSIMQTKSLFTGIGAAHLPGDPGVINLLRQMGYTIRPVVPHYSKASDKLKEKLEKTHLDPVFHSWTTNDGMVTLPIPDPGEMYETPSGDGFRSFLYPDMANGVSYSLVRKSHFGSITGQSQEQLMSRMDSLMFENIAGKILVKKRINLNGVPGYDLTHQTRSGDIIRQRILVTPLEIMVFKLSGRGDNLQKAIYNKFFDGIQLTGYANDARTFEPASGGFSVTLPPLVICTNYPTSDRGITVEQLVQAYNRKDSSTYLIMKSALHDFEGIESDTFELGRLLKRFAENVSYDITERQQKEWFGYGAMDATLKKDNRTIKVRLILNGPHYYLLAAIGNKVTFTDPIFTSFQWKSPRYREFKLREDTAYGFTAMLPIALPEHGGDYSDWHYNSSGDEDKDHLSKDREFVITNYATSESIQVKYHRFHKYYSKKSWKEFWDRRIELLTEDNDLKVSGTKESERDSLKIFDLVMFSGESSKHIKCRMILKGMHMFTLAVCTDSTTSMTEFTRQFFETFTPADTLGGPLPVGDMTENFFKDLSSGEEKLIKQALESVNYVRFGEKDTRGLMNMIDTLGYLKDHPSGKISLINALEDGRPSEVIPYLEKLYKKAMDTASIQLAIIQTLAGIQTKSASQAILELLNFESPLSSSIFDVERAFRPLQDSLILALPLYPDFLDFTRYPEYKAIAYRLLAQMVDSGLVKADFYKDQLMFIQRDARDELKRLTVSPTRENARYYRSSSEERSRTMLVHLTRLLIPFQEDSRVQDYFNRIYRSTDQELRAGLLPTLLENKVAVPDTVWNTIAQRDDLRLPIYTALKEQNRLNLLDTMWTSQKSMARAMIYNYVLNKEDSVLFVESKTIPHGDMEGTVYIFQSKKSGQKDWRLDVAGPFPLDSAEVSLDVPVVNRGMKTIGKGNIISEEVESIMEEVEIFNRKRAIAGKGNSDYWW
ncbi:MAG: TraB/GumN family protein, partial [Flavobacteriales bacterium]|nr:TraB/GumN family protein [Flavobacteriales bacterium]